MNIFFKSAMTLTMGLVMATGFTACSDDDENESESGELSVKEQALKDAVEPYVDNTVLSTYKGMADAAIQLYDKCVDIQNKFANNTLTASDVTEAGNYWKASRQSWELSEAFLFGPAAQHNIDPHIDSWPLDKNAMDVLLNEIKNDKDWNIDNNAGYGLIGYHSIEYVLFELSTDGKTSYPHAPSTYTAEILEYLVTVAEDLRNQCVLLEACWAGIDNISANKKEILEDAELDYGEEYGWEMKNSGQAGSRFKTYQKAAEEIIQGCIDIVDEVGNTKIGTPHNGSSEEDRNYIESPYALNSIVDFQDNIRSVKNSYLGSRSRDASISDFVKARNASLDNEVREALENAISKIGAIPEPFASTAKSNEAAAAIDACNDLQDTLDKVMSLITTQE